MTLWRLEWMRLTRTKRWIALVGVYLFFGLFGPLTARYLGEILDLAGGDLEGATIVLPPPVPADGMTQYVGNALQIGTLVAVVVAAGALTLDAIPEMGIFLRTRVSDVRAILAPRFTVTVAAVVGSFVLGGLAAWYETWALIGGLDAGDVLAGLLFGSLFLVFVVALVAAIAGKSSSVLGTVMVAILILLMLPIVGFVDTIGRWLPSHLGGALAAIPAGAESATDYLPATAVTIVATVGLLTLAVRFAASREL